MNERKDKTRTTIELDGTLSMANLSTPYNPVMREIQILNNFFDNPLV